MSSPHLPRRPLALLPIVVACACAAPPLAPRDDVVVSRTALEWTARVGDDDTVQSVVVENVGAVRVVVIPILDASDPRFTRAAGPDELHLAPGERAAVDVRFAPSHAAPALSALHLVSEGGVRHTVRLRAEVLARADCRLLPSLPGPDDGVSPIPLEVLANDLEDALPGPFSWSLVDMPDLRGPRLFADEQGFGLAVGLSSLPSDDTIAGGARGHLNVVQRGALYTVRVRDDDGRGCEATFFADTNLPGDYPHRSVVLTWVGEADLDLHVARVVDGEACYRGPFVDDARRCDDDDAARDCTSRACPPDADWNGDVYTGLEDLFARPERHPTGQGAELIYFPGAFGAGLARIAVEAIDAGAPIVFTLRVFHGRLAFQSRTGVILPGELREVTTTTF